jgi:hypothetical protein
MLTQDCYNRLDAPTKALVDSINNDLSQQKETRMNILWCGGNEIHPVERGFFSDDAIENLSVVNPILNAAINVMYDEVGDYVNVAADFYKALEDLAYDYDGFVLPKNPVFLAHFFYHAGIEMHTDKQEVKCFVTDDEGCTFSTIKVLV